MTFLQASLLSYTSADAVREPHRRNYVSLWLTATLDPWWAGSVAWRGCFSFLALRLDVPFPLRCVRHLQVLQGAGCWHPPPFIGCLPPSRRMGKPLLQCFEVFPSRKRAWHPRPMNQHLRNDSVVWRAYPSLKNLYWILVTFKQLGKREDSMRRRYCFLKLGHMKKLDE
jgi:hypothetical protein